MSFALFAFSANAKAGASANAGASGPARAAGPSNAASAQSSSAQLSSELASSGPASAPPDGASLGSRLFTDLQSLLATLTGTAGRSTGGTGQSGGTGASVTSAGSSGTATGLSSALNKDLQKIEFDLNSIASASGSPRQRGTGGPPQWSDDISRTGANTGSGTSGTGGLHAGYGDRFQKQFALNAYSASTMSGVTKSTSSALASINV